MPFAYLPIFAAKAGPEGPRRLVSSSHPSWCPAVPPLQGARVALLSSSATRRSSQLPFTRDDVGYRAIPSDPAVSDLVIDHTSPSGSDARLDPEVVFPRAALAALAVQGVVGSVTERCLSFRGGVRRHPAVEEELAPALASDLAAAGTDLALLVPY